jgi:hypothetical protein
MNIFSFYSLKDILGDISIKLETNCLLVIESENR